MTTMLVEIRGQIEDFQIEFQHDFRSSGITVLYGPNGSGKSTIISAIAGFTKNLDITVKLNDIILDGKKTVPPHKRPIGTMFQDPILFDHLNVNQNLDFAHSRSLINLKNKNKIKIKKEDLIENLELIELLKRKPNNLSGGEKLRVALARTLLTQPDYLLLDEPMSDVDIKYKAKLLFFLKKINTELKIPILYVSHSIEEISQISDNIILIDKGKKIEYGPVENILNSDRFQNLIGKFEASSIIEGLVSKIDRSSNLTALDINGQELIVPGLPGIRGQTVRVRIRSRDVLVSSSKINFPITENELLGKILNIQTERKTAFSELIIALNRSKKNSTSQILRARMTTFNLKKLKLKENDEIFIYISSVSFDRQAYQN
jgi:molybdate transport system ATP-binding protein